MTAVEFTSTKCGRTRTNLRRPRARHAGERGPKEGSGDVSGQREGYSARSCSPFSVLIENALLEALLDQREAHPGIFLPSHDLPIDFPTDDSSLRGCSKVAALPASLQDCGRR
ncbi:hypothetical protein F9C07_5381 [Aspergillus flavus]|uniref:Uncharacterized protein n=1 Tax=Aspergillus flavus (strain ATCC 200026 / FGSC A1120 / IAM 13836 / NRRL 3357 / JCM 12722 / SRRC 167) TaxID=332952 RepID=A0A7U2MWU2_ASPFN|nr:hypothetical protein F9C07_5381 [Aspergillus flavus]